MIDGTRNGNAVGIIKIVPFVKSRTVSFVGSTSFGFALGDHLPPPLGLNIFSAGGVR
jgi:hypothetical protein